MSDLGAHRSLIRELSRLLGPQRAREGSTENDAWIAAVSRVLIQRDELLEAIREHERLWDDQAPVCNKLLEAVYAQDSRLYEAVRRIENANR